MSANEQDRAALIAPVVDIWRSDLPGGDFGWQCHTCGRDQGGYLGWGTAEAGARQHEKEGCHV